MTLPLLLPFDDASLTLGASLLREGKLVAFPTETVYGLGADATNDRAVASIYAAKGRPSFNPLIVHAADKKDFDPFVVWNDTACALARALWPGPITLILKRKEGCPLSLLVSAGLDTVAIRIPNHPVALALLRKTGRPIAAPSANASGFLSPTTAAHVAASLGDKVDLILDGGACPVGLESTVINLATSTPVILRPGGLPLEKIEAVLGTPVPVFHAEAPLSPPSPGMLASHYAPHIPVRLNAEQPEKGEAFLAFGPQHPCSGPVLNLSPSGDVVEAAANLFAMLHRLDRPEHIGIAVSPIPNEGLGLAINDRLRRAAAAR
ncbi:MAG: L-threonylcarbamoyladenylate synthase [Alphaproteobacteria bacterium]|nr:L-threonylcarbamoyladenylate synthase [Alphaproteobacteria bacterium]